MATVKLQCAVYGDGSVFPVEISLDAEVEDLQVAIVNAQMDSNARFHVDPIRLVLYVARNVDGSWLSVSAKVEDLLRTGISTQNGRMRPRWRLSGDRLFGPSFSPSEGEIHVLVKLPPSPQLHHYPHLVVDDQRIPITEGTMVNQPALVVFWAALRDNQTEVKADASIELPEGTHILGDPNEGSRFYIRHCYPELWAHCQQIIHDEERNTPHLVILGTPGIGKTYFGFVILLLLARAEATVVYESGIRRERYLFSKELVVTGDKYDFLTILRLPTTYYIVDGSKHLYYSAKTILLSSPRYSMWDQFNKLNCVSCYMPVWSREEILKCCKLMYAHIPVAIVEKCFSRWGGVARYVLRYAQIKYQQVWLDDAMGIVTFDWLMKARRLLEASDSEVSHHFLNCRVDSNFKSNGVVFASPYVQQMVYQCLYASDKRRLLEFLATVQGDVGLSLLLLCNGAT